jgi:ribonuclease HII
MQGRTWKNLSNDVAEQFKLYLLENGGLEEQVKSPHENWRVKFSDSTFTYYIKGTIYSTPSKSNDPAVFNAWSHLDSSFGSTYTPPTKPFLIGLDETGKGEVLGHTVLTGVFFPKEIFQKIDTVVGPADTKKRRSFEYWDQIFASLDKFRDSGLTYVTEKIPPWHIDRYNINKIMDVTYQKILSIFFRKVDLNQCRIVLDDYGIGSTLDRFLRFLETQGAEIIVTTNSEDMYLEAKAASLASKRTREAVIKAINSNTDYKINGLSIGSGNAGDKKTVAWLEKWHASGKPWPWFVKRSFKTIKEIEKKTAKTKKVTPPIREDLLSKSFIEELNKGRFSIQSLALVCPGCGSILKSAGFANFMRNGRKVSALKCPDTNCGSLIEDSGMTLRYYCGYVIPDSSAIRRNIISNDLSASRFFEDFTVILCSVVRKECDGTTAGKKEFEKLRKYSELGRIRLETVGKVEDVPDGLPATARDERIIDDCLEHNAILLSGDKSMSAFARGKDIFAITV